MTTSISLLLIVCNEKERLPACIGSVQGWVDELVVVVQRSSDRTLVLAHSLADIVLEHPCHGYCEPSRPEGLQACTGNWILCLDADEILTDYGHEHLREWCKSEEADFYYLRRLTTIGDQVLEDRACGRLFRRGCVAVNTGLHTEFTPLEGVRCKTITEEVVLEHSKSWLEQQEDNRRYAAISPPCPRYKACPPIHRPGTLDEHIWRSVVDKNEYSLPDNMTDWVVLDVGGHTGAFAHACLTRGARCVWSIEPDLENFNLLQRNTAPFGSQSICLRYAVWRSDDEHDTDRLHFLGYGGSPEEMINTGSGSCVPYESGEIRALPLDQLIKMAGPVVDLLKLDCEGAEWPILHTSKFLSKIRWIIGEYHHEHLKSLMQLQSPVIGVTYSLTSLAGVLEDNNFKVRGHPTEGGLGLFSAVNRRAR